MSDAGGNFIYKRFKEFFKKTEYRAGSIIIKSPQKQQTGIGMH